MFTLRTRRRVADELLAVLGPLLRGDTVDYRGRQVRITPSCMSPNGPLVLIAGGSRPRRVAPAASGSGSSRRPAAPDLKEYYEAQCRAHPASFSFPNQGLRQRFSSPTMSIRRGPNSGRICCTTRKRQRPAARTTRRCQHHPRRQRGGAARNGGPYRVLTVDEAVDYLRGGQLLSLHPLCGGIAPELAWPYLGRAAAAVSRAHDK